MKVNRAGIIIATFQESFAASEHKQSDEGLFDCFIRTQRSEGEQMTRQMLMFLPQTTKGMVLIYSFCKCQVFTQSDQSTIHSDFNDNPPMSRDEPIFPSIMPFCYFLLEYIPPFYYDVLRGSGNSLFLTFLPILP
jgi:hypothetical protein